MCIGGRSYASNETTKRRVTIRFHWRIRGIKLSRWKASARERALPLPARKLRRGLTESDRKDERGRDEMTTLALQRRKSSLESRENRALCIGRIECFPMRRERITPPPDGATDAVSRARAINRT